MTVDLTGVGNAATMEILALDGRTVLKWNIGEQVPVQIDCSRLPAGLYFLQVSEINGRATRRRFTVAR
jgi:hypothetical protein